MEILLLHLLHILHLLVCIAIALIFIVSTSSSCNVLRVWPITCLFVFFWISPVWIFYWNMVVCVLDTVRIYPLRFVLMFLSYSFSSFLLFSSALLSLLFFFAFRLSCSSLLFISSFLTFFSSLRFFSSFLFSSSLSTHLSLYSFNL